MKKMVVWFLLTALLCGVGASAMAEPVVYTGASGFTLTLPDDWVVLFGDDDEGWGDLQPGDDEAMLCSADSVVSVTVLFGDGAEIAPEAVAALLAESALEARSASLNGYKKLLYRFDEANRRAFLTYSYIDPDEGVTNVEYLVGFITGSAELQFITVAVREDQVESRLPLIGEIVNSIDVGDLRDGAEG